jgi:anaerobic ribonucleoside-triphosphate reductase activating protein
MNWQLNKIQYPVYNLGPGKRLGIWVQGCDLYCRGCINKSLWDAEKGKSVPVLAVYEMINQLCQDYDGITITGGEPFNQYPQLMAFSMLIKRKTNLNILCYTGYCLNELETKFSDKAFYQSIDFLIDGRYKASELTTNSLIGSENQRIYIFSDGKAIATKMENSEKTWSVKCDDGTIYMAGIPNRKDMDILVKNLSLSDIIANLA